MGKNEGEGGSMNHPLTFCISTYNNLPYLKIAVQSVRRNSFYKDAPFIIHAENCTDGTNEWLNENHLKYNLQIYIQTNETPLGIGGGMNFCANNVITEYIMFLHSDFYVSENWDVECLQEHEKYQAPTWVFSYRVEPDMFSNGQSRPGTVIVPKDVFGAYHDDFDAIAFEEWAKEQNVKVTIVDVVNKTTKTIDITCNPLQQVSSTFVYTFGSKTYASSSIFNFLKMLNEGYLSLIGIHEDCKLKYAKFNCDIELAGTVYSGTFYTTTSLSTSPPVSSFVTAIETLINTIPDIKSYTVNLTTNTISIESDVVGGVEVYKDDVLTISVRIDYSISCRT